MAGRVPWKQSRLWLAQFLSGPEASASTLDTFTGSDDWLLRAGVAQNPGTPSRLLERLALDGETRVRQNVAKNLSASHELLERLALDAEEVVVASVAANPNTTEETLGGLVLGTPIGNITVWRALDDRVHQGRKERRERRFKGDTGRSSNQIHT